jgi:transcriptional regulator with XRE-family HTH domain
MLDVEQTASTSALTPTAGQFRAARAMLGWSQTDAARNCQVGLSTIQRLEAGESVGRRTLMHVIATLEWAGIIFLDAEKGRGILLNS